MHIPILVTNNSIPALKSLQGLFGVAVLLLCVFSGLHCAQYEIEGDYYVATCPPVAMILQEVVGERSVVIGLMQAGASPHTYEIKPSDARRSEGALALFYVDEVYDGWAAQLPARERIPTFPMVAESMKRHWEDAEGCTLHDHHNGNGHGHNHAHEHHHDHGELDPHYWADPLTVASLLPELVATLCRLDPEGCAEYEANAARFEALLETLHTETAEATAPIAGQVIALFHPSWKYYTDRYGLEVAALVEPYPGQESSPRYIRQVIEQLQEHGANVVFTEPQLPRRPAEVVAEAASVRLMEIDPVGGAPQTSTYADLIRYNTQVFLKALQ